jgi:hypothetical protein
MSDETTTTTLAGRLLELLEAGRSKGRQDRAAGKVWADILGVEHDSAEYLRLVADIDKMIADLVQLVSDSRMREPAKQNYKKTLCHILDGFQRPNLAKHWQTTRDDYLTDQQIRDLQNLDSYLADWHPSGRISDEQIEQTKADIDHVREQLDRSALPPELTKLLRSHVEAMRQVLAHYNIYGSEGLYDTLNRVIGELTLRYEMFAQHGDSAAVKAYKALLRKIGALSSPLNLTASGITIGEGARWLLGP